MFRFNWWEMNLMSYPNERIRGLQDLVERVSKELPLATECKGNAKTQYQRLHGVSLNICPSYWNAN